MISKDKTQNHLVYIFLFLTMKNGVSGKPTFHATRKPTSYIEHTGTQNLSLDTNKGWPIQNLLSY